MTRIEAVEKENEMLRVRIEELEDALGMRAPAPLCFDLSAYEARVFGMLMRREMVAKETVMLGLYGGRPDEGPEIEIVAVFICHLRKKIEKFGVRIDTVRGQGYRLSPDMKAAVRTIMQGEGMAA
ncbi:MAG: winged helix family transcriptional regulator [Salinibacterium sp.]|nr:MAG: winged helix family transcriptional regulator [Salinibacterium sp.]